MFLPLTRKSMAHLPLIYFLCSIGPNIDSSKDQNATSCGTKIRLLLQFVQNIKMNILEIFYPTDALTSFGGKCV